MALRPPRSHVPSRRRLADAAERSAWASAHAHHLADCRDCRAALEAEAAWDLDLAQALAVPPPPPDLTPRLAAAFAAPVAAPAAPPAAPPLVLWIVPFALAGACLTVLSLLSRLGLPWGAGLAVAAKAWFTATVLLTALGVGAPALLAAAAVAVALDLTCLRHPALKEVPR
jgi:hypothetical protein